MEWILLFFLLSSFLCGLRFMQMLKTSVVNGAKCDRQTQSQFGNGCTSIAFTAIINYIVFLTIDARMAVLLHEDFVFVARC